MRRERSPSRRSIFRGWWVVGAAFVGQSCSIAPLLVYTFGVFAKPLAEAFKSNRASIALAVSLLDIIIAVAAPGAGWLLDRFGARSVIGSAIVALALCLVGLAYAQPPLWHLYALYTGAGLVGVASSPVTYGGVVAKWFDRRRGLALGVASAGVGLGGFISPPFAQFLLDRFSWRGAFLGLAASSLVIALPAVGFFLRGTPQEVGLEPDGENRGRASVSGTARCPRAGHDVFSGALHADVLAAVGDLLQRWRVRDRLDFAPGAAPHGPRCFRPVSCLDSPGAVPYCWALAISGA